MQQPMKRVRLWMLVLLLGMLAACSPQYNWRQVVVHPDVGAVLFPAKPRTQSRTLDFGSHQVEFHLTTAEVGETTFALGYAAWPASVRNDAELRNTLGQSVIASLYRNMGQYAPNPLPAFGELFEVEGTQTDAFIAAQVWLSDLGVLEAVVMGSDHGFPQDAARQFLDGVAQTR